MVLDPRRGADDLPGVRALGASVLASAGLISVIAALAAQSTLGNVFAGLQLAFSDAVRVDDVVVVEGEWGRIEELTLTYVAVQIWDDRRLVLPTSYFTTKPFQNWTRTSSAVLGTAEIDVDWSVPVEPMRAELRAVCEGTELWDGRVCVLQVTDAVGGMIRLRALVSAATRRRCGICAAWCASGWWRSCGSTSGTPFRGCGPTWPAGARHR